jgi:NAD(P)-dependent dehydrogenase (short-subunit alcohol dehydrogenase family)
MIVTQYLAKELFKGKTVFVTGGGSGINLGVAKNFAALGANLAICGRTLEKLEAAAAELAALGAKVCPVVADVRDFAALEAAFVRSRNEFVFASATGFSFAGPGGRRPRRSASVVTAASSASISTSSSRFSAPARSSGK